MKPSLGLACGLFWRTRARALSKLIWCLLMRKAQMIDDDRDIPALLKDIIFKIYIYRLNTSKQLYCKTLAMSLYISLWYTFDTRFFFVRTYKNISSKWPKFKSNLKTYHQIWQMKFMSKSVQFYWSTTKKIL